MKNSHPILVRNIRHLTDARYFAAKGIDWISMLLDENPTSFSLWHTVRDWIEGVQMVAEPASGDESLIAKVIIDAKPDGIVLPDLTLIHLTAGITPFIESDEINNDPDQSMLYQIIAWPNENVLLGDILKNDASKVFLQADWSVELIKELKEKGYEGGFCLNGSPEDKVGVKDFSDVDEVIELIID